MYSFLLVNFISLLLLIPKLSCEVRNGKSYDDEVHLKVYQSDDTAEAPKKYIKLTEGHVLNLTCTAEGAQDVVLSWYVPSAMARSQHRLKDKEFEENRNLVISPISEVDSGIYQCEAISNKGEHLQKESVKVLVEPERGDCQTGFYSCNGSISYCIPKRYRCDGKPDCPLGDDESELACGFDPCKGKISCPELDYRCIDPSEHCCNPEEDFSCKVLPCCQAVLDYNNRSKDRSTFKSKKIVSSGMDQIFYTTVGCCIVFILVVAFVFALIKYQLYKSRSREAARQRPPLTLHDLDVMYGGGGGGTLDTNDRNLSITLNINHGVQIMRPPPYSNRIDGPPPPYILEEDVNNPLLQESNNNGDINGNSAVMDNNNPNRNIDNNTRNRNLDQGAAANGEGAAIGDGAANGDEAAAAAEVINGEEAEESGNVANNSNDVVARPAESGGMSIHPPPYTREPS